MNSEFSPISKTVWLDEITPPVPPVSPDQQEPPEPQATFKVPGREVMTAVLRTLLSRRIIRDRA